MYCQHYLSKEAHAGLLQAPGQTSLFCSDLVFSSSPTEHKNTHKHHGRPPLHLRAGVVLDDRCRRGDNGLGADRGDDGLEAGLRH